MDGVKIRPAKPSDGPRLRAAVVELHEHERGLHNSRLPGEETADAYLAWMLAEAQAGGAVLVAETGGAFAGFAAGRIVQDNVIEETPEFEPLRLCLRRLRSSAVPRSQNSLGAAHGARGSPPPRRRRAHPAERARRQRRRAQGLRAFGLRAL